MATRKTPPGGGPAVRIMLDALLLERRVSLEELAARTGHTRQALWAMKSGRTRSIALPLLAAICRELDCSPGDLLALEWTSCQPPAGEDDAPPLDPPDPLEAAVMTLIRQAPACAEDLATATGAGAAALNCVLLKLELNGLAHRAAGGHYSPGQRRDR